MTSVWETLAGQPWVAAAVAFAAFLALIGSLEAYAHARSPHPESVRKLFHIGSGLLTLGFPFLFAEAWPVLLLTGLSVALIGAIRFVPPVRARLGVVLGGPGRMTLGELGFPASVAVVFWLALGHSPLLYCIPMLVLTLADATSARVGAVYGHHRFTGAARTLEGSLAFVVVAFFCVDVPLAVWSDVGRVETLLISVTLALLVMLLEGSAWRGLDNLFIPIGGFFLFRTWLDLDTGALLARFAVTVTLVSAVLLFRRATTLEDDALLAGAFLCYVTWALLGWHWLVPPAMAFRGYAWMSPRTPGNSSRIHGVAAVMAVWVLAVVWLTLAHSTGQARLIYPFTLVFAGHAAIFGASRLAGDFPERPLEQLAAIAIAKSWLMLFTPFLILEGVSPANVLLALAAGAPIAIAVLCFAWLQPAMRHTTLDLSRWVRQAACAAAGSAAGWAALQVVDRLAGRG
jgi:phytol kinase